MKKYIVIIPLLALCIWSISGVLTVKAQDNESIGIDEDAATAEEIAQEEEVSYQELETETPKLLPNNPFHFIKKWNWGIKRIFTFNPIKRAELELEISDEQAAELKRLEEVDPDNTEAIGRAAENYQSNVERLRSRLEALKETSENPNVDKLLDKLTDRSIKHQRLFDNLKVKFENRPALIEKLENIQNRVDDVIAKIPEKFEDAEKFKNRIQRIIEKHPQRTFKELRAVEFLDRIGEKLSEDQKAHLQNLKEDMISKFENKIQEWSEVDKKKFLKHEVIKRLPGDNLRRINVLEKIEEKITDSNFRTKIQGIKEGLVERIDIKTSRERILHLIENAEQLIALVEKSLSEDADTEIANSVIELLERAKTHLAKANQALNEDKIGEAFGQANSAVSTARNALRQIQYNYTPGTPCPMIAIDCTAGKIAVKSGKNEKGCPIYKCISCPQYTPPLCKENEKTVSRGKDIRGCPLPPKCVPIGDNDTTLPSLCGGIAGIKCPQGYVCKLDGNYPDAGGKCVKKPSQFCIQVITPAISLKGVCKNFPTPCDVPATWKKVSKCPTSTIPSTGTQNTTGTTNQ